MLRCNRRCWESADRASWLVAGGCWWDDAYRSPLLEANRRWTAIAVIDCKPSFRKNKKEAKTQSEVRTKWCMAVLEDLFGAVGWWFLSFLCHNKHSYSYIYIYTVYSIYKSPRASFKKPKSRLLWFPDHQCNHHPRNHHPPTDLKGGNPQLEDVFLISTAWVDPSPASGVETLGIWMVGWWRLCCCKKSAPGEFLVVQTKYHTNYRKNDPFFGGKEENEYHWHMQWFELLCARRSYGPPLRKWEVLRTCAAGDMLTETSFYWQRDYFTIQ